MDNIMKNVSSIVRAAKVLELFLGTTMPLTVPEIVEKLSIPRSTAHSIVGTLVNLNYLQSAANFPRGFLLGFRVFELGHAYAESVDLIREGQEVVKMVAQSTGETVQLAVLEKAEVCYVAKADSTHPLRLVSSVGKRLPAHLTALGKMLLSYLSEGELIDCFGKTDSLPAFTKNSITSMKELRKELSKTRERGIAIDNGESNTGVFCYAAPVFDRFGNTVSAMSISIPVFRASKSRRLELQNAVRDGARELSRRLGFNPR
jgi:IclR family KDG regulon transcriptional repressor